MNRSRVKSFLLTSYDWKATCYSLAQQLASVSLAHQMVHQIFAHPWQVDFRIDGVLLEFTLRSHTRA